MTTNIPTIAVLLTCHNRREKTLQCLQALYQQQGMNDEFVIDVFLVDDGSTDGTAEAIRNLFSKVSIIQGDGNLYWNRGMHLAWKTAVAHKDFDYYLWLNDDTFLFENAIKSLIQQFFSNAIVSGTTKSIENQRVTYGGYRKKPNQLLIPNGIFQECDYCNGNCVLISKAVFKLVGNLDPIFHHAMGDFDYSRRAKKIGVKLYVAPDFIGTCESHTEVPKWRSPSVPLLIRIKSLYAASSGCRPSDFFVFEKRYNGVLLATVHYFSIHLRAIFPKMWR